MNVMRFGLFVVFAALTLPDPVAAQRPQPRPQRVDPLTATISGKITTADTGAPIRGAEVRLSVDGRYSRLATTNSEGRYELRDLPSGAYKLVVSRTGFITLEFGQRRPFETSATITLAEGQNATASMALIRGGVIAGRLLDQHSEPLAGTRVQVLRSRMSQGRRRLQGVGPGDQTDDTGAFRIYGLPPGDYFVAASTGEVDAVKRDPPVYYPGTANFAEAQPLTLSAGAEANADFQIAPSRTARVSGVVLNSSGAPVPGAMVNLVSDAIGMGPNIGLLTLHADGGLDGTFTIQNVPPGPYHLTAMSMFAAGQLDAAPSSPGALQERMMKRTPETAAMPVVVSGENLSGVTLVTRKSGRLNGEFVADTGVVSPLPTDLRVSLRSDEPGNITMSMGGVNGRRFQLVGVAGPTHLDVQGLADGWGVKAILIDGMDMTDQPFEMTDGVSVRIIMTDRVTTVIGSVESGDNARDHSVVVFPDDAAKWTYPSRYVRTVRSDNSGRFQIRGLPAERYLAVALDYIEDGDQDDPQFLERLRPRATSFALREGEQRSLQLEPTAR